MRISWRHLRKDGLINNSHQGKKLHSEGGIEHRKLGIISKGSILEQMDMVNNTQEELIKQRMVKAEP